jgi:ABC-type transport system involved in multi-copper enzyme maturation permease subunit
MRQLRAIVAREVSAFFYSAMAPVVLTGFLVAVGLFFTLYAFGYSEMSLAALQSPQSGTYINLAEGIFRPLVSNTVFFLMFLVPALSMRLFAPEFGSGRYDLMASWPVADHIWVTGKWLSGMISLLVMIVCAGAYIAVVWFMGSPEPGPALSAMLGELLFAGFLLAWGLLASALFSHQMVAYFLAFVWTLFLFLVGTLERFVPGVLAQVVREISPLPHYEPFSYGVIDTRNLLYFGLMTIVPLVAATAVLKGRRLPVGRKVGVWTPSLLVLVIAVAVYLLGQMWTATWDLTGNKRYSLAPQTNQILDNLGDDLRESGIADHIMVYAFYQKMDPAWDITEDLLDSCALRSRHFRYRIVDPEVDLELVKAYGITSTRTMVVTAGERHTSVLQPEESALISAVYRLATGKLARICHLVGHGEHRIEADDRSGYSNYAQLLFDQGYDVLPLALADVGNVPEFCDVLVIAGPRLEPEPKELQAIERHLARGGAVLALFDPPTPQPWVDWMAKWRVGLTGDVLVDVERVGAQQGVGARTITVSEEYGDHQMVRGLAGLVTVFPMVQPLAMIGEPDSAITGAIILRSSQKTWAETHPAERFSGRPHFDREADRKGPLPFGMVLELAIGPEQDRPGRMTVIGNSEFLNNATVKLVGNRDLLLNAIGWLAREEGLINLRGRDPLSQPVVLSATGKDVIGWGSILGWPLLVGSLALGLRLRRRTGKRTS